MDTRYTMRLAAPLADEEIPAFAARLADIIKGDPAKLESLLARGTKSLIRATTEEEAEKVATVFRRAGLDVEVVTREEAAAAAAPPAPVAAAPADPVAPAAEVVEAPVAVEAPPEPEVAAEPEVVSEPEVLAEPEPPVEPEVAEPPVVEEAVAAEDAHLAEDAHTLEEPDLIEEPHLIEEPSVAPVEGEPTPVAADESPAAEPDPIAVTPAPPSHEPVSYDVSTPSGPSAAARLVGLLGALLLIGAPFLGAPAAGIAFDVADMSANPFALGMVVLGLVSLLPVLLGRIRWLWLSALLTAGLWVYALIDSGRSGDLAGLLDQWAWLFFPGGALLMLIAALLPRPR